MKWMRICSLVLAFGSAYASSAPQQANVTRQVNNNGVRINYRVFGKGEPLVLIHGWPSESRFWETFGYVAKLSPAYQLIVPDMRGFGDSTIPANGDFSDAAHASDIRAVMDDLGIQSAHIFGFSVGGIVGYELAASSPQRVRSLIVLGSHPYAASNEGTRLRWASGEANLRYWEVDNQIPLPAESRRRLLAWTPEQLRAAMPDKDDKSERLKVWTGPGLLIAGTKDNNTEAIKKFVANSPNWKFVPIEGVSHGQVWIRSDLTLPVVQNFLKGLAISK
jgi:pimeloyl-ACP methyl ester carboxylesterase